ncbi:MAG: divalent cation tolerance protein CutA [Clostridia bacterium]|nr:divalent cation tolerance protein CutA [Clostridia bacterium]
MPVFENFLSYRRQETLLEVKNIYDSLRNRGLSVFCDIYTLNNGNFDENLIKYINTCTNYILVINNRSLDRCSNEGDWLYREINQALQMKKNIIIVFVGEVDFHNLPSSISELQYKNGLKFDIMYYDAFVEDLITRFIVQPDDWERSTSSDFVINDGELVSYKGASKTIVIPEEVEKIGAFAFKDNTTIREIKFNDKLKEIGESAFERCFSLVHIELPKTLVKLDKRAFARCYGLVGIVLNDNLESIGEECFVFCTSLKLFTLNEKAKHIDGSAFNGCDLLSKILVDTGNTSYQSIDDILYNSQNKALVRCPPNYQKHFVLMPNGYENIGVCAFSKCVNVSEIIISKSVVSIDKLAFEDCRGVCSITLPDSIKSVDASAFKGWKRNQEIIVSDAFDKALYSQIDSSIEEYNHISEIVSSKYILVKTTFEAETEAVKLARALLEKNLIVSGQISRLRSIYSWDGKICDENEFELSCITRGDKYPEIELFINSHHSFELCELMTIPIENTPPKFGEWITSYVNKGEKI